MGGRTHEPLRKRRTIYTIEQALSLIYMYVPFCEPGRVAQSAVRLTQEPEVLGSILGSATYFASPSAVSRRAVVSYLQKMCTKYRLTA